jgi:DNA-binding NarL/FixJ family response regulator
VILEHALGLHGKPVLQNQQIAKKLRLSPGAVSQRKAKIQAKLNLQDDLHVF